MTIILNQKVTSSQSTTDMELQSGGGGGGDVWMFKSERGVG